MAVTDQNYNDAVNALNSLKDFVRDLSEVLGTKQNIDDARARGVTEAVIARASNKTNIPASVATI